MKRSTCVCIAMITIAIPLLFLLCGCSMVSEQPDKEEFEQYLYENSDDFDTVLNYLIDKNGMVYFVYDGIDFENWFGTDVPKDVIKAIKRLKRDDTLFLLLFVLRVFLWRVLHNVPQHNHFQIVGHGIARICKCKYALTETKTNMTHMLSSMAKS